MKKKAKKTKEPVGVVEAGKALGIIHEPFIPEPAEIAPASSLLGRVENLEELRLSMDLKVRDLELKLKRLQNDFAETTRHIIHGSLFRHEVARTKIAESIEKYAAKES